MQPPHIRSDVPGGSPDPTDSVVVVKDQRRFPYSKGLMATSLMASGLPPDRSYELATQIERKLKSRGSLHIDTADLSQLAESVLAEEENEVAVRHFRQWRHLDRLNRPIILMLCGAAGVGKSTLATMLAHRLGITRVTATDMVRQVLRAFFSNEFMPSVHHSSFDADRGIRLDTTSGDPLLAGFERQAEQVGVGVKALIERAVTEGTPLVIEGVHALPGAFDELQDLDAVVVHVVTVIGDRQLHRSHFLARGASSSRATERYLDAFERIRRLQDYIVNRAHAAGVPVIDISSLDAAVGEVMNLVLDRIGDELQEAQGREAGGTGSRKRPPAAGTQEPKVA
jgi:2-phosphoglycerate kinase